VLGTFDGERLVIEEVHSVPNGTVNVGSYEYWDILYIFDQMQKGFKKDFVAADGHVDSAGISTWGIDFGLMGPSGEMLGNPLCYRNNLGAKGMATLDDARKRQMFNVSGIQNHPMNSVYQLAGIRDHLPEYYDLSRRMMLIPDLLNYLFTGNWNTESSIASTTQLMNMRNRLFDMELFTIAGIKKDMVPPLVTHGSMRGMLRKELAESLDIRVVPFVAIPSHDTAAAVVAVPVLDERFVFISSGTWSLIGTELGAPLINEEVYASELANEGGLLGTITLLKNSAGMHILQNVKNEMEIRSNRTYAWAEIIDLSRRRAEDAGSRMVGLFDPNHESLYNPESMIQALKSLTGEDSMADILHSVYLSMACNYRKTISDIEKIIGYTFPEIYIIGGGSQNDHLNQLTADIAGRPVIAGPVEATSIGSIAVQLLYHVPGLVLSDLRRIVGRSFKPERFEPRESHEALYQGYLEMIRR
jgi:sugar (pentulose or hexulose) kinase